ncbi:hypothetical protein AG1IA_00232 [Rhizoctonia solani AG-1 IA]|uniref:Uncharacterized protein n=1 Tax=Thanatephorus cucumeris (strain AG1-IA) TaxID=983506 RepID=L8XAM1_THACA|nr:hypothetical protein AG1IA_00232 [Rhizoctonia solani AG-1 IA]
MRSLYGFGINGPVCLISLCNSICTASICIDSTCLYITSRFVVSLRFGPYGGKGQKSDEVRVNLRREVRPQDPRERAGVTGRSEWSARKMTEMG